jgi:hypothetical protein
LIKTVAAKNPLADKWREASSTAVAATPLWKGRKAFENQLPHESGVALRLPPQSKT